MDKDTYMRTDCQVRPVAPKGAATEFPAFRQEGPACGRNLPQSWQGTWNKCASAEHIKMERSDYVVAFKCGGVSEVFTFMPRKSAVLDNMSACLVQNPQSREIPCVCLVYRRINAVCYNVNQLPRREQQLSCSVLERGTSGTDEWSCSYYRWRLARRGTRRSSKRRIQSSER